MATHLLLRARRDFVAHSHADVRLKNGEVLDFGSPSVQAFIRSALGWDAFAVEFIGDGAALDAGQIRADAEAALQVVQTAEAAHREASIAYQEAQDAVVAHDRQVIATHSAAVIADKDLEVDEVAAANQKRGDLKRTEIAAATRVRETAAALAKAAEESGRLVVLVHTVNEAQSAPEIPAGKVLISEADAKAGAKARDALNLLSRSVATWGPAQILVADGSPLPELKLLDGIVEAVAVTVGEPGEVKADLLTVLAHADPEELAKLKGVSAKKAVEIIEAANDLLGEREAASEV